MWNCSVWPGGSAAALGLGFYFDSPRDACGPATGATCAGNGGYITRTGPVRRQLPRIERVAVTAVPPGTPGRSRGEDPLPVLVRPSGSRRPVTAIREPRRWTAKNEANDMSDLPHWFCELALWQMNCATGRRRDRRAEYFASTCSASRQRISQRSLSSQRRSSSSSSVFAITSRVTMRGPETAAPPEEQKGSSAWFVLVQSRPMPHVRLGQMWALFMSCALGRGRDRRALIGTCACRERPRGLAA